MRAFNTEFELFDATRVPAGVWDARMRPCWRLPAWRRSGGARENTKQLEQSQGVLENKGHHFFEWCKLCASCTRISTN